MACDCVRDATPGAHALKASAGLLEAGVDLSATALCWGWVGATRSRMGLLVWGSAASPRAMEGKPVSVRCAVRASHLPCCNAKFLLIALCMTLSVICTVRLHSEASSELQALLSAHHHDDGGLGAASGIAARADVRRQSCATCDVTEETIVKRRRVHSVEGDYGILSGGEYSRAASSRSPAHDKNATAVPRCIHFLHNFFSERSARDEPTPRDIPAKYMRYVARWKMWNPNYCIVKHNPEDIIEVVRRRDERLHALYNTYGRFIQRCDVARYILMYYFGGIYSDLDVEVKEELASVTAAHPNGKVFLGVERVIPRPFALAMAAHKIRNGSAEHPTRIANFWMMSAPKHPFWRHVLAIASRRAALPVSENYDIIFTTGPDLLTEAYHTYNDTEGEVVILSKREFSRLLEHKSDGGWKTMDTSYCTHLRMAFILVTRSHVTYCIAGLLVLALVGAGLKRRGARLGGKSPRGAYHLTNKGIVP